MAGKQVSLSVNGSPVEAYLAKASDPAAPAVLLLHPWWGLTPYFKQQCDRLAAAGITAFAPSLFGGKTAATIPEAEALVRGSDNEQVQAVSLAALAKLRRLAPQGKLGVIGFSFGAAWALVLSTLKPEDVGTVTLFYGGYPGLDFSPCKAALLGHYAETDEWGDPMEDIRQMETEMLALGLDVTIHVYPGVGHWFFEEDRPDAYNEAAASLAWDRTLDFLRRYAGGAQ